MLRLKQTVTVTPEQLEELRAIRSSIVARRTEPDVARPIDVPREMEGRVDLLGRTFVAGEKPGAYRDVMDERDREAQVLALRGAKEYADFAIFSMHVHENRSAFQAYSHDYYPPDYVVELAHQMVDNGMDVYHGHGNHTVQGIEIYKGRPIFYNLGNFSVHRFGADGTQPDGTGRTYIEAAEVAEHYFQQDKNLMAIMAEVDYRDGVAAQVRIHPVELGLGKSRPWSRMNIPMTPTAEDATMILEFVRTYSAPFGTDIRIEGGVGYIDIAPEATQPVGQTVRDGFKSE